MLLWFKHDHIYKSNDWMPEDKLGYLHIWFLHLLTLVSPSFAPLSLFSLQLYPLPATWAPQQKIHSLSSTACSVCTLMLAVLSKPVLFDWCVNVWQYTPFSGIYSWVDDAHSGALLLLNSPSAAEPLMTTVIRCCQKLLHLHFFLLFCFCKLLAHALIAL